MPWPINNSPVDNCTPRMTDLGIRLPIKLMLPVAPITRSSKPTRPTEAATCGAAIPVATA